MGVGGVVLLLVAAGLGQATRDHVADGQEGDVKPCLLGAEVATVYHGGCNEDADDGDDVDDQLSGLVGRLGLRGRENSLGRRQVGVGVSVVLGGHEFSSSFVLSYERHLHFFRKVQAAYSPVYRLIVEF